ncbi:CopG family transcriptional regulator [Streptomyces sp. NPDC003691]
MNEHSRAHPVTGPRDAAGTAEAGSAPSRLSAAARRIERRNLDELIRAAEGEHGPITDEEVQSLREQLTRARSG